MPSVAWSLKTARHVIEAVGLLSLATGLVLRDVYGWVPDERVAQRVAMGYATSWMAVVFVDLWWRDHRFYWTRIPFAARWSSLLAGVFMAAQVWIDRGRGVPVREALSGAPVWLYLWPMFFLAFWLVWPKGRAAPPPVPQDGLLLLVDRLPGARESLPAVLYALAVPVSAAAGALAVALVGGERASDVLVIGSFVAGTAAGLCLYLLAARPWTRGSRPDGSEAMPRRRAAVRSR